MLLTRFTGALLGVNLSSVVMLGYVLIFSSALHQEQARLLNMLNVSRADAAPQGNKG
jgi:hypothetical protein